MSKREESPIGDDIREVIAMASCTRKSEKDGAARAGRAYTSVWNRSGLDATKRKRGAADPERKGEAEVLNNKKERR